MSETTRLFTIGFTKKTAEDFFTKLTGAGVKTLVDVRLNNVSQLAGFSKRDDLRFFLKRICGIEYVHMPLLAPTQEMLDAFKKEKGEWKDYERKFLGLMAERRIEESTPRGVLDLGCLLCSEETAEHCHRRLVGEYLQGKWEGLEIVHLV
jgi:uncharacterized protein (DUF488 family)